MVTDAVLDPDPLIEEPICLRDRCRRCLKACVMDCLVLRTDERVKDYRSLERDDPGRIFIDTPSRSIPSRCMSRTEATHAVPVRGDCLRVCPIPKPSRNLPKRLQAL